MSREWKSCRRPDLGLAFDYPEAWALEEEQGWIHVTPPPPGKGSVMIRRPRTLERGRADAVEICSAGVGNAQVVSGEADRAFGTGRDVGGLFKLLWVVVQGERVVEAWVVRPEPVDIRVDEAGRVVESIRLI